MMMDTHAPWQAEAAYIDDMLSGFSRRPPAAPTAETANATSAADKVAGILPIATASASTVTGTGCQLKSGMPASQAIQSYPRTRVSTTSPASTEAAIATTDNIDDNVSAEDAAIEAAMCGAPEIPAPVIDEAADPDGMYQLVEVAGIRLAIPLAEILQAVDAAQADAAGWVEHLGERYRLLDLGAMMRPDESPRRVETCMLIRDRAIAIPCERILDMRRIEPKLVCWRDAASRHDWLAGTLRAQGVAILDMPALAQLAQ
jgi:hypothetical protein